MNQVVGVRHESKLEVYNSEWCRLHVGRNLGRMSIKLKFCPPRVKIRGVFFGMVQPRVPRESRRNTDTQAHANLQLRDVDGILVRSRALHPDMQRCFLAAFVHVVDTDSASDSNVARRGKAAQPRARRPSRLACQQRPRATAGTTTTGPSSGAAHEQYSRSAEPRARGYHPRRLASDGRRCPQHAGCISRQ